MSDNTTRMYEGMFLFPQSAIGDMNEASDHIHSLLDRANAEIVSFSKWDDRRLAYEIKGNKRGVYFLCFFRCDPTKIASLERDCNLSESLLRFLVTKADHINMEDIEAADGRTALADEIKLRAEQAAQQSDSGTGSTVSVGRKDEEKPAAAEASDEAPAKEEPAAAEPTEETPAEA
jgi:ribosomal protein S6